MTQLYRIIGTTASGNRSASEEQRRAEAIRRQFQTFHKRFPWLGIDDLIEYFSIYGGIGERVHFDFFETLEESVERHFVREFAESAEWITPEYLRQPPRRELLIALARGDAKMLGAFRRAKLGEGVGGALLHELVEQGTLELEHSREAPIRPIPGRPIRKELRGYRIQDKARFTAPYLRFWFGFVEPFTRELERGEGERFMENYRRHRERAASLVFERLSSELLELHQAGTDPLLSKGTHWDFHSEFDLLAHTRSGELILGECKFTGRPVCRNELGKLREKAAISGIRVDRYALFSRSGFSRELQESGERDLLLFDLKEFTRLLE